MKRFVAASAFAAAIAAALAWPRPASTEPPKEGPLACVFLTEKDLKWTDAPPSLPPGAQVAMLEGDTTKEGPFTMRLRLPAGWKVGPHTHPGVEHVTVISGSFWMGSGEVFDEKALKELPTGGFAVMQKGAAHHAMAKGEAVVQVHGMGPWAINYVNPADDPRNKK